jgi:hypothetical protein
VEGLAGRLWGWVVTVAVAVGDDRRELFRSQGRYGRADQHEAEQMIDGLAANCRKVLHPAEVEWRLRLSRLLRR